MFIREIPEEIVFFLVLLKVNDDSTSIGYSIGETDAERTPDTDVVAETDDDDEPKVSK